jgi:uncharacterized flavoprotein (TIGR03862 family)
MAAEAARAQGAQVHLYDRMGSVGRKILIAGKGGLNLTHSEPFDTFRQRYGPRSAEVGRWLDRFDAEALRSWAAGLGVDTFVGSSGRVFPVSLKAAPLLRGWVRRLRAQGVVFHMHHQWCGWNHKNQLRFATPDGEILVNPDATVLALGGGSWAKLGSDGRWMPTLAEHDIPLAPLKPANCGFNIDWSPVFRDRHSAQPVKAVALGLPDAKGRLSSTRGEFVITDYGIEGSLVYAWSARLRDAIEVDGEVTARLDLFPGQSVEALAKKLAGSRGKRSFSDYLRRALGLTGVRAGLLRECCPNAATLSALELATQLKALPLHLQSARPIDEAISTAGGVMLESVDDQLMTRQLPGVFCAGEMLDWEAPTGGYLLTACLASGLVAGQAAAAY